MLLAITLLIAEQNTLHALTAESVLRLVETSEFICWQCAIESDAGTELDSVVI